MADIGFTHVALPVRSLAASVAFYGKYASMHTVHRRPGVVWVSDRTRPFALVLIETSNEIKPLLPMAHLGVGVRSREEVDRLCRLAREEQCLAREPEDSGPPVGYWALIRDPDGHTLEVRLVKNSAMRSRAVLELSDSLGSIGTDRTGDLDVLRCPESPSAWPRIA